MPAAGVRSAAESDDPRRWGLMKARLSDCWWCWTFERPATTIQSDEDHGLQGVMTRMYTLLLHFWAAHQVWLAGLAVWAGCH